MLAKWFRVIFSFILLGGGIWFLTRAGAPASDSFLHRQALAQMNLPALRSAHAPAGQSAADSIEATVITDIPAPVVRQLRAVPAGLGAEARWRQADDRLNLEWFDNEAAQQRLAAISAQAGPDNYPIQLAAPAGEAMAPLLQGVSFPAINFEQSLAGVPPDPDMMVGPNHIVVGVNTSFAVYSKSGALLAGPIRYTDLWSDGQGGTLCGPGPLTEQLLFDPFSTYDESADRFILGITANFAPPDALLPGMNGYLCLAVSQTGDPTQGWYLYSVDANPGGGTDYFADFPHIGTGQQAIYASANMFNVLTGKIQMYAFAILKSNLYAGNPTIYSRVPVSVGGPVAILRSFYLTMEPVDLHGYTTGGWPTNPNESHYFVASKIRAICPGGSCSDSSLRVYAFNNPFSSPTVTTVKTLTVDVYRPPVAQPQLGGNNLTANDTRALDAEYRAGDVWVAHHTTCNPGSGNVMCVRWYQIDVNGAATALVQQGTFAGNNEFRSFPSLAVDRCGNMALGYTKTSAAMYPSVFMAGREVNDPLGQLKGEAQAKAGERAYVSEISADVPPHRWGDYTQLVVDPNGRTLWYIGEYAGNQNPPDPNREVYWSTWVQSYQWPSCTP